MNNDESLTVNRPSLPKGGGAIRSIGDGFGAVGVTGRASYELALPISTGRGFAPSLSLAYSSDAGNSRVGMGWSITSNAIVRRTSKGVPGYDDADAFVTPDGQAMMAERNIITGAVISRQETHYRAMPVGTYSVTRYWPRIESAFALIERWFTDDAPAGFWLLHTRDGNLHMYGRTSASRLVDPDDPSRVGAWLIDESLDPHGHHVAYQYMSDPGYQPDDPHQHHDIRAQRYLEQVHYGNKAAHDQLYAWQGKPWDPEQWHFHLVFDYGKRTSAIDAMPGYAETEAQSLGGRQDAFSDFSYGFELRTRLLCKQVLMFHRFDALGSVPVLVNRLLLEYRATDLGYNHLVAAHSQAVDGKGVLHSRPPVEFFYQPFAPVVGEQQYQRFDAMSGLNDGMRYQLVDLDGEGLPGILYITDKAWYYRSPSRAESASHPNEVAYTPWRELQRIPNIDSTQSALQYLGDITGDGNLDWVCAQPGWCGFFTRDSDGTWKNFTSLNALPNEFFHPRSQFANVMGDGLSDLLMIGPRSVRLYASKGAEGFASAQEIPHCELGDALPLISHSKTEMVGFSDLLGTGQPQLFRIRHNKVECWPSLGRGRFGKGFVWCKLDFDEDDFDVSRVMFADFDGSGASDLVYLQIECAEIYMNRCGNEFAKEPLRLPWPVGVTYDRFCQVSIADLQGVGYSSLVLTVPHMTPRHWRYDLGQAKPYLLCASNNNLGAAATIVYRSSAQEWLDEKQHLQANAQPAVSRLPFALLLVSAHIQQDEITGTQLTQRFHYRKAFYDGVEREFHGFALQLSSDCEEQAPGQHEEGHSAPVLHKTWFHVGDVVDPPTHDYFGGDGDAVDLGATLYSHFHEADDSDQLVVPDAKEQMQMCNALVGQVLRSEVFDLGDEDGTPYFAEQYRYLLRRLQRPTGGQHAPHHVLQVLPVETISYRYERDSADPVCQKVLNLHWDAFGSVTNRVTVYYARRLTALSDPACQLDPRTLAPQKRWWCDTHDEAQQCYYLTHTRAQFINLTEPDAWHLGLPYLQRSDAMVLVKGAGPKGLMPQDITYEHLTSDRSDNPLNDSIQRQLVGQSLQRYRKLPGSTPWPDGQAGFEALPDYLEVAVLDQPALQAYDLLKDEHGNMPFDLAARLTAIGYHRMPWMLGPQLEPEQLWSIRKGFYTYTPLAGFYQVLTVQQTQSHGVTELAYDADYCMSIRVKLPDGCETRVGAIDYRLLQPSRIIDPNLNTQEVLHGAFGQVLARSFHGSERGLSVGFKPLADYQRPEDDSPAAAINAPELALCGASTAYFENPRSWMGRVPEADRRDYAWLQACVAQGELLPDGHVRARARQPSGAQALSPAQQRLRALVPTLPREPVHGVTLQADQYRDGLDRQIRIAIGCWDGFGRLLQNKQKVERGSAYKVLADGTLALDDNGQPIMLLDVPRWHVSERVEYNNKGEPVRVYRPYFASIWQYINDASFSLFGYHDKQFYDPLGRLIRTVLAKDGHLRRQTHLPWYTVSEDENDTLEEVLAATIEAGSLRT